MIKLGVTTKDTIIAAVSGGLDSMLMLNLLVKAGYKVQVAHCNFKLRGDESDGDEAFVVEACKKLGVHIDTCSFDTLEYAMTQSTSIQVAARELRYEWFEKLRVKHQAKYIATAHHLTDSVETILINQIRGTGLAGYHGIPEKQGNIIRPLMFLTRQEIKELAELNKVIYREDSSNSSDKYLRNKIRHNILPVLYELNPDIEKTFAKNAALIRDYEDLIDQTGNKRFSKVVIEDDGVKFIDIESLKNLKPLSILLYEYLKHYNFKMNIVEDIIRGLDGEPGRVYESRTHRITKDRAQLILEIIPNNNFEPITINEDTKIVETPRGPITIIKSNGGKFKIDRSPKKAYLDAAKVQYPLTLRRWQEGDYFQPLGMQGKKKLSDFLIDQKVPLNEKEKIMVLASGNQILWVVGHRIDDRVKITDDTQEALVLSLG